MKKQMCMFLVFVFLLVGCGGQNDKGDNDTKTDLEANLLYENTISPNEKYVENEADLVYYTVKVYQETGGLLVTSHPNSAHSARICSMKLKPMQKSQKRISLCSGRPCPVKLPTVRRTSSGLLL